MLQRKVTPMENNIRYKIVGCDATSILGAQTRAVVRGVNTLDIGPASFKGISRVKNFIYNIDLVDSPRFEMCPVWRIACEVRLNVCSIL